MYPWNTSTPYFSSRKFQWNYANRESIFFITGALVGFPALVWALRLLYRHQKSGGRTSFIVIFLLHSDLLEIIFGPVFLTNLCKKTYSFCIVFSVMLYGARACGHLLHQLVALESILIQKYPPLAVIFSPLRSIIFCIFVWLIAIGCQFFTKEIIIGINMCLCVVPVMVCAVTCLVTCKAPPDTNQTADRKPGVLVLSVAIFTLLISYAPFSLAYFFYVPFELDSLASMRLISEPLLGALVCRENQLSETIDEK